MPTPTYVALAKTVLSGNQANIEFTGIPSTYTDLVLVASLRTDQAGTDANCYITVNGTATNYSDTYLYGSGTSVIPGRDSSVTNWTYAGYSAGAGTTSNTFTSFELYIPNYAGSTNKVASSTSVVENNNATAYAIVPTANLLSNTAAITSIKVAAFSTKNFVSGSRIDLYGIKNS